MNRKERISEYYNKEAHIYNYTHGAGMYGAQWSIKNLYLRFFRKFITPDSKVLEVGCGTGVFTEMLKTLCKSIVSTDIAEKMIIEAKKRNPDVNFKVADIEKLPFQDGEFDVVIGINSFSYVPNKDRGIKEVYRVLNKRGKFLLIDMNLLSPIYYFLFLFYRAEQKVWRTIIMESNRFFLRNLFKKNRYKVLSLFEDNYVPHNSTKKQVKLFYLVLQKISNILPFLKIFSMRIFIAGEKNDKGEI